MANENKKTAISPKRSEDFPMWYQAVVRESDMAEMAHVRGCMVIKPWGYGIWENIQSVLGGMIKDSGAENAYFPLFIPMNYIQKEADHVEGFAKEMAVVTHHRLQKNEDTGELKPAGELTEAVIVRPTSETIIGESFSQWIKSYRDLPVMINQWCNVVRWEMRPRVFLRTVEFLWQEGHTAHATQAEAEEETLKMVNVYRDFVENWLAIPVIVGSKPPYDRFPGAVNTLCIEAMMQDGKALQAGTSHYLGQNFAKSANISFAANDGTIQFAHTTSWGVSTRLIGGLIMTHADDDGMRVPPKISPYQVIVIPFIRDNSEQNEKVMKYAEEIRDQLKKKSFAYNMAVKVKLDDRIVSAVDKKWTWIKKGAPIQVEVGPKDLENDMVTFRLRSEDSSEKHQMKREEFIDSISDMLNEIQENYYNQAKSRLEKNISEVNSYAELEKYFANEKESAFVLAPYYPSADEDSRLKELGLTIRCIPFEQDGKERECILSGKKTDKRAIFARAY